MKRYKNLVEIIRSLRPQRILEIGTCTGENSEKMVVEAVKHRNDVEYYGFDLFEVTEDAEKEFIKTPASIGKVADKLRNLGAVIHLFKGNTRDTLQRQVRNLPSMDFVFIDGGHSQATIRNDWKYVQRLMHTFTVVIFDDYWTGPALDHPHYSKGGCKFLIDELEGYQVELLEPIDKFKHIHTQFVKVTQ